MRRNYDGVLGMGLGISMMAGLLGCNAEGVVPLGSGTAELTVIGHDEVLLGGGWQHEIEVRYHDRNGEPLAGAVEFRVSGDRSAATLSHPVAHTNDEGIARTTIEVGDRDAELTVIAEAADAEPAAWNVQVASSSPPLRLGGEYVVESQLVPLRSLPRPVERAVGVFDQMTEGELAPAAWVLDEILDNLENEGLRRSVEDLRPQLDEAVYEAIRETSPDFHDQLADIAAYLDEAARHVGVTTVLQIGAGLFTEGIERTGPVATHTLTGMAFRVGGGDYHYAMGFGTESVRSSSVRVGALGLEEMEVGKHQLPLRYGGMLEAALEQVILPRVATRQTTDLETFFRRNVDCVRVSEVLNERVPDGSPALFQALCEGGTEMAAELVMDELLSLDEGDGVYLDVIGHGIPYDTNDNQIVDRIAGSWSGAFRHGDRFTRIDAEASEFDAQRVDVR